MEIRPTDQWQSHQPDRRREERRQTDDRREMIRFEPDKTDRRGRGDRRKQDSDSWGRGKPI